MSQSSMKSLILKSKSSEFTIPLEILIAWESSDEAWCLKDIHKTPVYTNARYALLLKPIKGGTTSALSPFQAFIAIHDQRVIDEMRKVEAIGIFPIEGNRVFSIFYCERMPYYDNKANIIGIISHIKPLNSVTPRFFVSGGDIGKLTSVCPGEIFTDKEWLVAFLLLQGMAEKEIADILHRTLRTIKFHKTNILAKAHCSSTREFMSLARKNQWQFYIPPLFSKPCYIIK
ncbi:helix-turn-helix transcriptional regulator [Serratia sp. (in: enterobacteria)]|uniref:helix-turn-helix transcriptional regulator n=1 Tax=Serratia sp. (in: enterobacteria) TaxID=616 RepID=UPI00398966F4